MLQRLGIRGKILAVVAVPTLALLLVAGFVTYGAVQDLSESQNAEQIIDTVEAAGDLASALQDERWNAINYVHSVQTHAGFVRVTTDEIRLLASGVSAAAAESNSAAFRRTAQAIEDVLNGEYTDASWYDYNDFGPVDAAGAENEFPTWPTDDEVAAMAADLTAIVEAFGEEVTNVPNVDFTIELAGEYNLQEVANRIPFLITREITERTTYVTEPQTFEANLEELFTIVDTRTRAFDQAASRLDPTEQNERLLDNVAAVLQQLGERDERRIAVRERNASVQSVTGWYRQVLDRLLAVPDDASATIRDSQIAQVLLGYAAQNTLIERMATEKVIGENLLRAGEYQTGEAAYVRRIIAETNLALDEARRVANPLLQGTEFVVPLFGASRNVGQGDGTDFDSIRVGLESGVAQIMRGERTNQWPLRVDSEVDAQAPARAELLRIANVEVNQAAQNTLITTIATGVLALAVVFLSLLVAFGISRRIIGPLRRLTTTASAVRQELPRLVERVALPGEQVDVSEVQIPVESQDEIGRLAEAFNSVNAATLAIAGEQAALRGSISEMFVNVARRDQVLLNRQLASIDEMERTQDDPETLRRLFALDHLATRMRRNSESLLVLAGIDTGRRLRRPMPLSDVIRTASSEIELYERVQLELDVDPAMLGHSALTAAHLFAELLENATVFSDPGTPVIVRTAERGGAYVVEVADSGIGMTPEELREANARVASTAASEILGAQRLGLFVVGRIARRVGARVEIFSREGEGTVASVTMPPTLFDPSAVVDMTHTRDSTADANLGAPAALIKHREDEEQSTPSQGVKVESYQPVAFEQGTDLAAEQTSVPDEAPIPVQADTPAPQSTSAAGLPTRRRKASDEPEPTAAEPAPTSQNVLGLPAQATDAQLQALEQESQGFTPAVPASEVAPQSVEERAQMFRGFRARREADVAPPVDPEAESLGQVARRTAVAPDSVPALEDDQEAPVRAAGIEAADVRHDSDPVSAQSPLISTGYEHTDSAPSPSTGPMEIPLLEDDDAEEPAAEQAPTPAATEPEQPAPAQATPVAQSPVDHRYDGEIDQAPAQYNPAAHAGVDQVTLNDTMPAQQYAEPQQAPPSQQPQQPVWQNPAPFQPATASPFAPASAGSPEHSEQEQSGFFGKLFGKSKRDDQDTAAPAPQSGATPVVPGPATGGFMPGPAEPQAPTGAQGGDYPGADQGAVPSYQDWNAPASGGGGLSITPAAASMPYNPGNPGTPAPAYSADQLANPLGWETAGASALEASQPEVQNSYTPVVDLQPAVEEQSEDYTSEAFSEFSSLTAERPKVEKTKAGLAKRTPQPVAAPTPAPSADIKPVDRDPEKMRKQFSNFYSGTQRAREDVAELERQNHPATAKE